MMDDHQILPLINGPPTAGPKIISRTQADGVALYQYSDGKWVLWLDPARVEVKQVASDPAPDRRNYIEIIPRHADIMEKSQCPQDQSNVVPMSRRTSLSSSKRSAASSRRRKTGTR